MERSTVIMLGMLFIALGFLLVINGVEGMTITVDANGGSDFTKIQDAINISSDGDTIRVWEGTYYENVVVNKSLQLIGNGSEETTIDVGGSGIAVRITADWVNMSGFMVTGSGGFSSRGIKLESDYNHIFENNCSNSRDGIYLRFSNNSTITNNTCLTNNESGIYLRDSSNNTLTNNTVSDNKRGIYLRDSSNNTLTNNTFSDNERGIYLTYSSNNTLTNDTFSDNERGISLFASNDNTLINNTISDNKRGIYVDSSNDNAFTNNTISENIIGIYLRSSSRDNNAHDNIIFDNTEFGINGTENNGFFIDASYNWWGDRSGPYNPEKNSMGKGDNITTNVIFKPWRLKSRNLKPEISYVNIKNNSVVGSTVEIIVTAIDYDGFIINVEISINGSSWFSMEQYKFSWIYRGDSSDLPDGETEIKIRCYDGEDYSDEVTLMIMVKNSTDDKDQDVNYILYILLIILITILISVIVKVVNVRIK